MEDTYQHRQFSTEIETLDGRFVDPLDADPATIDIFDIAHALSQACRFSGYTRRHYSVAEHSVNVARLVAMRLKAQWGFHDIWSVMAHPNHKITVRQALLHDATEAYLIDMPSPVKRAFPDYRAAEKRLWAVIARKFAVPEALHVFVAEADGRICTTEKTILLTPDLSVPQWAQFARDFPPYEGAWDIVDRYPVDPKQARRRFLDLWDKVKPVEQP